MQIILNHSSMTPIYEQVVDQINTEIIENRLKEGDVLPSVRSLAGTLKISALTVKKAYDALESEGFTVTVHGKGTYVAAADKSMAMEARRKAVEDEMSLVVDKARLVGMRDDEIRDMLEVLLEI